MAALEAYPDAEEVRAVEIQEHYAAVSSARVEEAGFKNRTSVVRGDFFELELDSTAAALAEPVLVVGNPPWATSARLGSLGSTNLPQKRNFKALPGMDALTGRSNFDIAEWFVLRLAASFAHKSSTIALLCKTSVARQSLAHLWRSAAGPLTAACYRIDAKSEFSASTDACLLVLTFGSGESSRACDVYSSLEATTPEATFGLVNNRLVANLPSFEKFKALLASKRTIWRSGIKHDCSPVMELTRDRDEFINGLGERVELEPTFVFPLVKATQLFHRRVGETSRAVIVPQRSVGEETNSVQQRAPRTWDYLQAHSGALDGRKSSIYRGKPRFSVFGVGAYSFVQWKVAISALHKELRFSVVGPFDGKPTMLDDTCYFLGVDSRAAAESLAAMLECNDSRDFFSSLVFWDAKRPITTDILGALDIAALAARTGVQNPLARAQLINPKPVAGQQGDLFTVAAVLHGT
jgi:hypothetical protein